MDWEDRHYSGRWGEIEDFYQLSKNKTMSNLYNISWVNLKSALVSAFITIILGLAGYILQLGDVYSINIHNMVNIGVLSGLVAIVSLIKSFSTTAAGNFVGIVKVK